MIEYSNLDLLNGIRRNDTIVLQYIYKNFYSKINFFIKKNSGDDDDANDIFQEAIIIIFRKLKANELVLDCTFETYLYSVCRFLWLKQLDNNTQLIVSEVNDTKALRFLKHAGIAYLSGSVTELQAVS